MTDQTAPSLEALARAFYEVDPVNTCCVPNELHDEYFMEARAVLQDMQNGLSLLDAMSASLVFSFEILKERADRHAAEIAQRLVELGR